VRPARLSEASVRRQAIAAGRADHRHERDRPCQRDLAQAAGLELARRSPAGCRARRRRRCRAPSGSGCAR
jgi:hypothetical protein